MRPTVRKAIFAACRSGHDTAAAVRDDGDSAGDVTASTSTVAAAGESAAGSASGESTADSGRVSRPPIPLPRTPPSRCSTSRA